MGIRGKRALTATMRRTALAAAVMAVAAVSAGCGSSSPKGSNTSSTPGKSSLYTGWPTGGTPVRGGRVVIDGPEAPAGFLPYKDITASAQQMMYQIYDQLVELVPGKGPGSQPVLAPGLASSWTINSSHTIFTFHIRAGVRFSNGEPLTGEDVVFSLKHESAPTSAAYPFTTTWKKISLITPMTVRIVLSKPSNAMLEYLDGGFFGIFSKGAFEHEGAKAFELHPIGTGAFMLKSATTGFTSTTLARNPSYWRTGQPYLNEVVFNQVESDNARVLAARSGSATIAQQVPYGQVASLKSVPGVKMLIGPLWGGSYNLFNRAKTPFNDTNVRRALLYATPTDEIIKSVYDGLGTPVNSLWGEFKYVDPSQPRYLYDVAKAKELLKQTSVPHGFDLTIDVSSGDTQGELMASILQSSWGKLGIHATIQTLPPTTLNANFLAGKYQFDVFPVEVGYSIYHSPDTIGFYFDNSEPGFGPPASARFVARLNEADASTSETVRQKLFRELQREGYWEEALWLPVTTLVSLNLVNDSVRGFEVLPTSTVRLEQVWLQK
jgi:peptide/nickel transport system substrate-binding protein